MIFWIIIGVLIFLCLCNLILLVVLAKEVYIIKWMQKSQSNIIIRLVYHKAKEIEDYETLGEIKKQMPKDFNYYKF